MALSRQYRLTTKEFEKVFNQGRFLGFEVLNLKIFKTQKDYPRFGFVVGPKVSKKAYERNRLKRQLREAVGLSLKRVKPGQDIIVIAKPELLGQKFLAIQKALEQSFQKAKVLL